MPLGQKGPRGEVLVQLKRSHRLSARELASRLEVSLNAARHHLKELEAAGLVSYQRENRGVGAP
ncbi:MAG: helix-turn-helix domain-containing protein, partial [Acidobacteria bacterium]|nr:helix-turn-helix domain-containing protein [Acidobacteriota bacterium]